MMNSTCSGVRMICAPPFSVNSNPPILTDCLRTFFFLPKRAARAFSVMLASRSTMNCLYSPLSSSQSHVASSKRLPAYSSISALHWVSIAWSPTLFTSGNVRSFFSRSTTPSTTRSAMLLIAPTVWASTSCSHLAWASSNSDFLMRVLPASSILK